MDFQKILAYKILDISLQNLFIAIAIFIVALIFSNILSKIFVGILQKITSKTKTKIDDQFLAILEVPLKFSIILLGFVFSKEWLNLSKIDSMLDKFIHSFATFIIFWILYRLVEKFAYIFEKFSSRFGKKLSADIENFIVKTLKILVVIIAFMSILQGLGINVSAFLASLGLVGMAFALAAKDTAANLFGSLVVFTDRPFKLGDWVLTPDVEGTVENIGIRSTRIRAFSQALISVPNATIANSPITNWSQMGKRRIKTKVGLTYKTTKKQMQNILEDLRDMLKNHDDVHNDTIMIRFDEFGSSSLNIFCYFFTNTTNWAKFLEVKEDINFKIMDIVEKNGTSFAFPSQSVYIESLPKQTMG
ncbi:MAG: mechanosensitive ion channel family protein [Epsilonproteobacteria bacterium]|nr:mechanosensitive ion channel family protein [Campylobacterota bacterium]